MEGRHVGLDFYDLLIEVIAVGIALACYPPRGPGRALVSASGSYRG